MKITSNKIEYKFLNENDIGKIHQCMMHAFADYEVDLSYLTLERLTSRARMDRVDYGLSVGAFDGKKMIAYLAIGLDKINGELCAFDAGTGVIEEYRGMGVAGNMFDFALPELKKKGVKVFLLEVLQGNDKAIKAYKKSKFEINRSFNCYKIETKTFKSDSSSVKNIATKPIQKDDLHKYLHFNDWEIPWEYRLSAIENISEELVINGAFLNEECIGFIVYYPTLEWIFMLSVAPEFRGIKIGSLLLSNLINEVKNKTPLIKFNNLPPEHKICEFLEKHGFELYITQYEMKRRL